MTLDLDELERRIAILRAYIEHDMFTPTDDEVNAIEYVADHGPAMIYELRKLRAKPTLEVNPNRWDHDDENA